MRYGPGCEVLQVRQARAGNPAVVEHPEVLFRPVTLCPRLSVGFTLFDFSSFAPIGAAVQTIEKGVANLYTNPCWNALRVRGAASGRHRSMDSAI